MFKYTVFFAIRCFASDTVPEVARCSGPKSGTERILTAVRRPFRRILRAGIFRGARSRFVRFVGSCARHSCREGRCNLFFCFPRPACSGCAGRSVGRPPRSRENSEMLSTQIKSCLFLLETDSFCSHTVALHTRICQPTVKIRITSLSLLSQWFQGFLCFSV